MPPQVATGSTTNGGSLEAPPDAGAAPELPTLVGAPPLEVGLLPALDVGAPPVEEAALPAPAVGDDMGCCPATAPLPGFEVWWPEQAAMTSNDKAPETQSVAHRSVPMPQT